MKRVSTGVTVFFLSAVLAGAVELKWVSGGDQPGAAFVEVSAFSPEQWAKVQAWKDWGEVLEVRADGEGLQIRPDLPAMMGRYEVGQNTLRFVPRFPLVPGLGYRAVFRLAEWEAAGSGGAPLRAAYRFEAPKAAVATRVTAVYPSAAVLPVNLLKMYLHFSAPMSRGRVYEHVRVRDAEGKVLELAFLELEEELWNGDQTRLTLLFDPGRIKRGLLPREQEGPVFEVGKSYTLEIDADWEDGNRQPLGEGHRKTFQIGPADERAPDPARWQIETPPAGSVRPLVVRFDEPMDSALVRRLMGVETAAGVVVEGSVALSEGDRCWQWTPIRPWASGSGVVRVKKLIEDLAGNQIGKVFDVDVFNNEPPGQMMQDVKLGFEIQ